MRIIFIKILATLYILTQINSQIVNLAYAEYVSQYNKIYSVTQYRTRQVIYNNLIASFPILATRYNMTPTINNLTDWNNNQLPRLRGYIARINAPITLPYVYYPNVPDSLDWRNKSGVTGVKYQSTCAADWAFAATAYAESKLAIDSKGQSFNRLSDQQIFQCTRDSGCTGGRLQNAMVAVTNGLSLQSTFSYNPWQTNVGICSATQISIGSKPQNYYNLKDEHLIQLLQQRPVAVAVSSRGWETYNSGVFTCNDTDPVDHAVLLVGYTPNYWIVKNSWGQRWGQNGFIRISRLYNCQITSVVVRTYEINLNFVLIGIVILLMINI